MHPESRPPKECASQDEYIRHCRTTHTRDDGQWKSQPRKCASFTHVSLSHIQNTSSSEPIAALTISVISRQFKRRTSITATVFVVTFRPRESWGRPDLASRPGQCHCRQLRYSPHYQSAKASQRQGTCSKKTRVRAVKLCKDTTLGTTRDGITCTFQFGPTGESLSVKSGSSPGLACGSVVLCSVLVNWLLGRWSILQP